MTMKTTEKIKKKIAEQIAMSRINFKRILLMSLCIKIGVDKTLAI